MEDSAEVFRSHSMPENTMRSIAVDYMRYYGNCFRVHRSVQELKAVKEPQNVESNQECRCCRIWELLVIVHRTL